MQFNSSSDRVKLPVWGLAFTLLAFATPLSVAHATWSVVAVNPTTGQVGTAGASCYPGVATIAHVVPGKAIQDVTMRQRCCKREIPRT
jgi:hypothetical protein